MARILMSSGLAMAAGSVGPAHAGVWNFAGQSQLSGGYDDNLRLSSSSQVAAWSGAADVSGQLLFQNDAWQWRLNPRLVAVRYDGQSLLNRDEKYLTMLMQKTTERASTSVSLSGAADTTLTSELGLTGFAEVNKPHRNVAATITNTWQFSERIETSTQLYAAVNHYLDAELTGLFDYNYGSALLNAGYDWNERSKFTLQASVGKLQVPDVGSYDKTNLSVSVGYGLQLAPRWRIDASFGPSKVRTKGHTDSGSVYSINLSQQSELTNFSFAASRDVTPTGQGALSQREQLRLSVSRALGARWSTDWSVAVIRNRNLLTQGGLGQDVVTYGDAGGSLSWRINPSWNISLSAGYARQQVGSASNNDETAQRRHAAINLSWNGPMRRLN